MSKNKDPAVLFYTADFLTGVNGLTMEERGQYITLLCVQHQQGPLTEKLIRLSVGEISEDVRAKFSVDDQGRLYNERMLLETAKRARFVTARQENGALGGRPKKPKENLSVISRLTYAKPTQNLGENENININSNDLDISNTSSTKLDLNNNNTQLELLFNIFWSAYPRKKAKIEARRQWSKLGITEELMPTILGAIEAQKQSKEWQADGGRYIPYPATWLHQGRWLDESTEVSEIKYSNFSPNEALKRALERSNEQ